MVNRREFAKLGLGSALASGWRANAPAQGRDVTGVRFSVMLWSLAKQAPFEQCLEWVAAAGYQGVELVGEFQHWTAPQRTEILAKMRRLGLVVDAMSGVKAGFAVPLQTAQFRQQFAEQLRAAQELGCPSIILLSGERVEGLEPGAQMRVSVENLKWAAELAGKQAVRLLIEPIDLLENPTIFLASVTEGFRIAKAVGSPHLKVLYDVYHEQRSFGNLLEKLERDIEWVGLVHVADVPGRHEPGTGEIQYNAIYRKLAELNYSQWIAMEFYPTTAPVDALRKARLEALRAMNRS